MSTNIEQHGSSTILGNKDFVIKKFVAIMLLIIRLPCCAGIPKYSIGTKIIFFFVNV
jgi:hypothetical protein